MYFTLDRLSLRLDERDARRAALHADDRSTTRLRDSVRLRACELAPRFNIAPGQDAPVAIVASASRVIERMRWGLLPRWRGHGGKRGPLIHAAPLEAVAGTPLLRDAFKKQRCLVLADGCYAWRELKQPIWFHPEPRRVIAFAGVWNVNDDDGMRELRAAARPAARHARQRCDADRARAGDFDAWLDPKVEPDDATELLRRAAAQRLARRRRVDAHGSAAARRRAAASRRSAIRIRASCSERGGLSVDRAGGAARRDLDRIAVERATAPRSSRCARRR